MNSPWRTIIASLHNLFFVLIAFCCGIAWQAWHPLLPSMPFFLTTTCSLAVIVGAFLGRSRRILWLLLPSAFICGALRYQAQQDYHAFLCNYHKGYHTKLVGVVTEKENLQHPYLRQRITLSLIKEPKALIYILTPQKIAVIPGDTLQLENITIEHNANSDYATYLIKEGITFSVFLKGEISYKVLALGKPSWSQFLSNQRARILVAIKKKLSKNTFALFSAIFLGYKHATKEDLADYKNLFKNWGLLHYLARAGLHVVIIISLLQVFTRTIPCPYTLKQGFMTLFIVIYWLLSWPSTSFMRALFTFFLFSWCAIARWQSHFLHLLTLSCFFTLLFNPLQLFFLDFQLSYCMTYALAFLTFSRSVNR